MKKAFIYTEEYSNYDYGPTHPLRIIRLKLAYELIKAYGLLNLPDTQFIPTQKANEEDLLSFHEKDYIEVLKRANLGKQISDAYLYGLGPGDNPIFLGLFDWSLLVTGGTLQAVDFVASGNGNIAFNIAGGLHHAHSSRASGFCYINDPVIGILKLIRMGRKVAYIDIDAHHGDGVQKAFYQTDQVLTISLHQSGYSLFPGTGFEYEIGEGKGEGYSVNLPFPPHTDDENYLWAFEQIVPPLIDAFKPDIVVTQLGVDTFYNDPLANLDLTIYGFEKIVKRIKELSSKWIALGGGGYNILNVAKAWTICWAIMNEIELGDDIPKSFLEKFANFGIQDKSLRGERISLSSSILKENRKEIEKTVEYIKNKIFPKIF